jgi:hypothetical protein
MTDPETRIAELEAHNAALAGCVEKMNLLVLEATDRALKEATKGLYLLGLCLRYRVPIDPVRFHGLANDEPESPKPERRAEIQLIN